MNLQGGESRPVVVTEMVMLQVIFRNMLVKKNYVCVCLCVQKRVLNHMELELEVFLSCLMCY